MSKRFPQPDLTQVSQIDWARLAAFIDGEGSIRIAGNKGAKPTSRRIMYVDMTIANTDVRLTQWLARTFGGSVHFSDRKNPKWAPVYFWNVASRHASQIIEYCLPYFLIKREQAEIALAFQATIIVDRRYGCKGRPAELLNHQFQLAQQLSDLKGTAAQRGRRSTVVPTVQ